MTETITEQGYTVGRHSLKIPEIDESYKYIPDIGRFIDSLVTINGVQKEPDGPNRGLAELVVPPSDKQPLVIARSLRERNSEAHQEYSQRRAKGESHFMVTSQKDQQLLLLAPQEIGRFAVFLGFFSKSGFSTYTSGTTIMQYVEFQDSVITRNDPLSEDFLRRHRGLKMGELHALAVKEKVQDALRATVELLTD